jgi:hypothetical protein
MRLAENVYHSRSGGRRLTGFPMCFPQFTGKCGCGINSERVTAPSHFFRTTLKYRAWRVSRFRLRPGFRTLRIGLRAVATPTLLRASKEDAGKGGASPAPLPKVLAHIAENPWQAFIKDRCVRP